MAEEAPRQLDEGAPPVQRNGSVPPVADSSLDLFGHGWTPKPEPPSAPDGYRGRHRAPDGTG
jgi:hypothetical protein